MIVNNDYIKKEQIGNKFLGIIAALSPWLMEYFIKGTHINLAYIIILVGIFLTRNVPKRKSVMSRIFIMSGVIFITLNLSSFFIHGNEFWYSQSVWNNILFLIPVTFLTLYWYPDRISLKLFIKITSFIAIASSLIIIYQRISYILIGNYYNDFVIHFIPGIEFCRNDYLSMNWRASAIFSEPSNYALYTLPIFVYYMQKQKKIHSIILAFGIIASGSTNGIVSIVAISLWIIFVGNLGDNKSQNKLLYGIIVIVIFLIVYKLMTQYFPEIMNSNMGKIKNTDIKNYSRLLGPLPILQNFNLIDWLCGIGIGNKLTYINFYHINVAGGSGDTYTNTFFSLIVFFGMIGVIVYGVIIMRLCKKCCKGYSLSFLLLMIILFFSTNFVFENVAYYCFFIINTSFLINGNNVNNKMKYNVQDLLSEKY